MSKKRKEIGKRRKFIDLSVTLKVGGHLEKPPQITYWTHAQTGDRCKEFGLEPSDFPRKGEFCAAEDISLGTHTGTHLDAPWHYGQVSEGKPARTIDQVPLEWCYGDGVVLDLTHKKRGEEITKEDVEQVLANIDYKLKPFDIVLIRTDTTTKYYDEPGFENMHPGMSREATQWLIEQGIKVMGIDAWGWDRPMDVMAEEVKRGIKHKFWAAHFLGIEREYCHIERLANLDQIPQPYGFKLCVFPVKIEAASAGWVRAVAIIEE